MLFHVRNAFRRAPSNKASFSARLRLNSSRVAEIVLRPFAGDIFVLFEVLLGRCYQIPDAILSPERVRVILDCGANIGITSLYFASRYPNARIFSIEPDKENFALLKRNTAAEPRIIPIHGAIVGRARKSVHLTTSNPAWGNFITEQGEGLEVPALAVEQILELNGLSRIDLLKSILKARKESSSRIANFCREWALSLSNCMMVIISINFRQMWPDLDFGHLLPRTATSSR